MRAIVFAMHVIEASARLIPNSITLSPLFRAMLLLLQLSAEDSLVV